MCGTARYAMLAVLMMLRWCSTMAWLLGGALSCTPSGAFECSTNDECGANGVPGVCQPSGYCSFGDPECESGQRYGQHAPGGLAEQCVPIDDTTGSGPGPVTPTQGDLSDSESGSVDVTTAGTTTPVTSGPASSTSTGPIRPGDTSTGESGTSTGDTGRPACPTFIDDFEDGSIDPTWNVAFPEWSEEADGQLMMTLSPNETTDATGVQLYDVDLSAGTVELELGILPAHFATQLSLLLEWDDGERVSIVVQPENLSLRYGVGGMDKDQLLFIELDPVAHHWIRFEVDGSLIRYEASPDGIDWTSLLDHEIDGSLEQSNVHILGTNWSVLPMEETLSIESFRMCTR